MLLKDRIVSAVFLIELVADLYSARLTTYANRLPGCWETMDGATQRASTLTLGADVRDLLHAR